MKNVRRFLWLLAAGLSFAAEPVRLDTGTGILYGTLELPAAKPPFPVVLIIAGSGPTDRDGNSPLFKGKNDSLKMVAEGLAARGIASLRYDKRFIAESHIEGAKEQDLRFETYVDDAVRWGGFLRKDARFTTLIVAGHSEGSLIGMIAAQKLSANGYISIAGPGRPAGQILLEQFRSRGVPAEVMKETEDIVKSLNEGHQVEKVPPTLAAMFRPSVQPYVISWFKYDPSLEIAKLKIPVLILQGTTDIQVSVEDAKLLAKADPAAKLALIEGMNHVLKEVPSGMDKQLPSYGDPKLPLAPTVLDEMSGLVKRAAAPPH